ncbi:MAG: AI-2E family transporter [Clostridia bacterium]|nr:AI-2E family transporter [Clostridia bacterium]
MNIGYIARIVKGLFALLFPVITGFVIAFILNVPMKGFEKLLAKLTKNFKKKPNEKLIRGISLLLTILSVLLVVVLVCVMLIPEIVSSVISLYELVKEKWPEWAETLALYNIDTEHITAWFENLNIEEVVSKITSGAGTVLSSAMDIVTTTVSGIGTFFISVIIAIYVLISKKDLGRQVKKLIYTHLKDPIGDYICRIASMINETYSKFLSGQCVEACILGSLIFIFFRIFEIPYAILTGVLTAVFAFVPYVGAFLACFVGAFLVLLTEPSKVLVCIIVYLVVQFVENQFIYPHVVGNSVGLSPLWTLIAVLLGGKLMGVMGMVFFIPLTAVVITLLKAYTEHVIKAKKKKDAA